MPSIGVVVTALNEARHLPACLHGLARQALAPDMVVLVDDGSTDSTLAVMRSFAADAPFPTRVLSPGHIGRASALNLALSELETDLVAIQDADDVSLPHRLAMHAEAFARTPELDWHSGQVAFVDTDGRRRGVSNYPQTDPDIHAMLERRKMPVAHCASAYRTALSRHGMWYDPSVRRCQDLNLLLRRGPGLLLSTSPEVIVDYRNERSDVSWSHWCTYRAQHHYAVERALAGHPVPVLDEWLERRGALQKLRQLDVHEWVYQRWSRTVGTARVAVQRRQPLRGEPH